MKTPCNDCPFRKDSMMSLNRSRAIEIVKAIHADTAFHCHKTVSYRGDNGGKGTVTDKSELCIGSAIFLEKTRRGGMRANVCYRLAVMCKRLSPSQLGDRESVYDTVKEFIENVSIQ